MCRALAASTLLTAITVIAMIAVHGSFTDGLYYYFPLIPSRYFQGFSVWFLYYGSCVLRNPYAINCRSSSNKDDLWVTVASAKGGTVLAARTSVDIGFGCGLCVGFGHRPDSGWPPAKEYVPTYKADMLLALANMQDWHEYAKQHGGRVRCVVITRNPRTQFKSLYSYSYAGSEYGLLHVSKELRVIHARNITLAVNHLFETIGRQTMIDVLSHLNTSLSRPDCIQIKFEDLQRDFNGEMNRWASAWGITDEVVRQQVITIASKHDLNQKSAEELAMEHHTSSEALSKADSKRVDQVMVEHKELQELLRRHAQALGYRLD